MAKSDKPSAGKQRKKDKSEYLNTPEKIEEEKNRRQDIVNHLREHGFQMSDEEAVNFVEGYFEAYEAVKRKVGRPGYYVPQMDNWAIWLGARGYSMKQIAFMFGISYTKLWDWAKKNPEFGEALTRAREASQNWWEVIGQAALFSERFNFGVWNKIVSTRFRQDYTDRKGLPYNPTEPEMIEATNEVMQLDPRDLTEEQREILRIAIEAAKIQEDE